MTNLNVNCCMPVKIGKHISISYVFLPLTSWSNLDWRGKQKKTAASQMFKTCNPKCWGQVIMPLLQAKNPVQDTPFWNVSFGWNIPSTWLDGEMTPLLRAISYEIRHKVLQIASATMDGLHGSGYPQEQVCLGNVWRTIPKLYTQDLELCNPSPIPLYTHSTFLIRCPVMSPAALLFQPIASWVRLVYQTRK